MQKATAIAAVLLLTVIAFSQRPETLPAPAPAKRDLSFEITRGEEFVRIIQEGRREMRLRRKSVSGVALYYPKQIANEREHPVLYVYLAAQTFRLDCENLEVARAALDALAD